MIQLNPGEQYPIVRVLGDHTDSTTYFVQAVARNAVTDAVIDTLNLTDQGNRRFSINWEVPVDGSGLGLYVVITSTVYTDSGFTTKSDNYTEEALTVLIQQRWSFAFGNPGGTNIDYKRLRKIVAEEVESEMVKRPTIVERKNIVINQAPVIRGLQKIADQISGIDIPAQESTDITPVLEKIREVLVSVSNLPNPERVNLEPVLKAIADINVEEIISKEVAGQVGAFKKEILELLGSKFRNIARVLPREEKLDDEPPRPRRAPSRAFALRHLVRD